jgi:hypothetical protein
VYFHIYCPWFLERQKDLQHCPRMLSAMWLLKVLRFENPARQSWWICTTHQYEVDSCCPGICKLLHRGTRVGIYPKSPRAPLCGVLMTLHMLDGKQKPFFIYKFWGSLVGKFCTTSNWKIVVRDFILFVRTQIAIKMDDCILYFKHFDFICENFIKALNMTSIALEFNP